MANDLKSLKKRLQDFQVDNDDLTQYKYEVEERLSSKVTFPSFPSFSCRIINHILLLGRRSAEVERATEEV